MDIPKRKILIVEDEPILAQMYKQKFTISGFDVFLAYDTEEGIEFYKKERPDIVLLDILLGDRNGIEFIEKVRKFSQFKSIPIIIFSNFKEKEVKDKAIKLGAKEYIIKAESTPRQILETIEKYLK